MNPNKELREAKFIILYLTLREGKDEKFSVFAKNYIRNVKVQSE